MRPPFWKVWLSYFYDVHVESVSSTLHTALVVALSKGRYRLSTPNAVYSYGDLYTNFSKVFDEVDWAQIPGDRVLLAGLGLGSIPYMLETKYSKAFEYTAIEIDSQVIRLANKYVLRHLKSPVTTYQADAVTFVKQADQQWDLICSDIFVDDSIPDPMLTAEFLTDLKQCLTPGGLLLYNCLSRTQTDIEHTSRFVDDVFLQVFPDGYILDVRGNWILASEKSFFNKN